MATWMIVAVGLVVIITAYLAMLHVAERKDTVRARVKNLTTPLMQAEDGGLPTAKVLSFDEDRSGLAVACEGLLRMIGVNVETKRKQLQSKMGQAGITSINGLIFYLFAKWIALPALGAIAIIPLANGAMDAEAGMLMRALYGIVGFFVLVVGLRGADLYVSNCIQKRQQILTRSFPDALDLLLVCVESGLALDGALARVCRELGRAHPDITEELNRTRLELSILSDRSAALQNLSERTNIMAFKSLVAALIQSEKFGTSLSETLRVLSEDYRHMRLMLAEQKAGRLPVLMTIPLILCMLPAFFLIVLGPALIRVFQHF